MNLGSENETLEFKKSIGELKEGVISICSMLNKTGYGTLYFGVKNDGTIIGQEIGVMTLKNISQAIANFIKPQIIPTILVEFIEDTTIVKVEVKGDNKPYSAYGRYYIRSSDEDRDISPENLKQLMRRYDSDSIVRIESNNQFLTFNQLKNLYMINGLTLNEDNFKHNLNLVTSDNKYNLMADILSDNNTYSIKVAKFSGVDKIDLIKRNEYGYKCLILAIQQVLDYVESLNETFVNMDGPVRKETKLFDFSCFREAWLNACLHNKWSRLTPPAVYMYSNRIEIISTGGLPIDYSEEDFYKGRSNPVNIELQKIMGQLNLIEQTGHGVPLIVSKYGKSVFEITDNFITVTIPYSVVNDLKSKITNNDIKLTKSEQKVLNALKEDNSLTVSELCKILDIKQTAINVAIKGLKEKGIIKRVGSNKEGYWDF
ncbi:MAG: winged helix-turn-helix transcriptional regulator [Bacilli bacterium]|jgi:Predicted transcriptional regulator containing an HTH domain and an uncharacterized domain shared with the mammalian protein Schlafen|nr:winged helix-turn-helix transcriptional regulator [Bacilli bacterium]